MDSELMHSIVGSYHKPPERVFVPSFTQNEPSQNCHLANLEVTSPKILHSPNSQALILALKTLQEKIHCLELERTQAEDNLNILSREAAQYKKALENETNERNLAHQELIKQKKDISIQLSSAQSRCTLLEKQLEYTKRMVLNGEREKNMILEQQAQLQKEKEQDQMKLYAKLEKLDVLEKECFRLTTTQRTAEDKIKHLEEKLKEEEHQCKLFQDKASELQTGLEISKIIMPSVSNLNKRTFPLCIHCSFPFCLCFFCLFVFVFVFFKAIQSQQIRHSLSASPYGTKRQKRQKQREARRYLRDRKDKSL
uniref:Cep57 centrosome localisation domain-containing protein n=1 Tax=Pongo abelii TaxID=9601 RepID=A0A8I5TR23_PONAB